MITINDHRDKLKYKNENKLRKKFKLFNMITYKICCLESFFQIKLYKYIKSQNSINFPEWGSFNWWEISSCWVLTFSHWTKAKWHVSSPFNIIDLKEHLQIEAELIPQNVTNAFNVNIDFSIQIMQNYCYIIDYVLQFFPENFKFQLLLVLQSFNQQICYFI